MDFNNLVIAYEPVWAMGTNKTPISEIKLCISLLKNLYQKI